jgi:type I restriction enzyme M protein
MRRDSNCSGVAEYLDHLSWLLFLKFIDEVADREPKSSGFMSTIPTQFRWSEWAHRVMASNGHRRRQAAWTADELFGFVHNKMLPELRKIAKHREGHFLDTVFGHDRVSMCSSPENFQAVVQCIDALRFDTSRDLNTISQSTSSC